MIHTVVALHCVGAASLAQPLYALMTAPSIMRVRLHRCYPKKKGNVGSIGDDDNNLSSVVQMVKGHLHVLFHRSLLIEYLISPLISWYRILSYQQCPRITMSSA